MSYQVFQLLALIWIGIAVVVFLVLLKVRAPYGRHIAKGWGPEISNRLGWIFMELPVLVVLYLMVLPYRDTISITVWFLIACFSLHYIYRALIFPFRLKTKGKTMPVIIVLSGVGFNLVNGSLLGYYFAHFANYPQNWLTSPIFLLGIVLFLTGMMVNRRSDNALIALRKPGETGYIIPRGGMFELISCPNHFGEILEWGGYALMCWNLPALSFFIWTMANLIPRAIAHHRWYLERFAEYPESRKAVLPYLL